MKPPPFDVDVAHRWFAIELNNLAWDLVESGADVDTLVHAAHAACFHWSKAGNLLNALRAHCLLATAYAKAGLADGAVRYAEQCVALSLTAGDTQAPFDRATAYGAAVNAYTLAGRHAEATAAYALALAAAETFDDPSERPVFDRFYPAPHETNFGGLSS